jgi:NADPH:quinone reductase-like Zn-dependent oxidoreductase
MVALLALYEGGRLRPLISATYGLTDAARALAALADRRTTGKVVLVP